MSRFRARIAWHGDFLGEGSLARVNRHLARAVIERGDIEVVPFGESVEAVLGLAPQRPERLAEDGVPLIALRHRWPPEFHGSTEGYYVHIQPWEFGSAPREWIERLRAGADAVWCNSTYVRDVYASSGIDPDRLQIVPHGIDPNVYHPNVEPLPVTDPNICVFLYVGGMPRRKNVEALLNAYLRTFSAGDPVALVLKDSPLAIARYGRPTETLRNLEARTAIPTVRYVDREFSDGDMARLYRIASALVHPYRGEGFGMPVLEAMGCGVPVVVTAGGATDDFVDDRVGYPIPATRTSLGTVIDGFELVDEGWWLDPDVDALGAILRRIFEHRDEARAKGRGGAERTHLHWTWSDAARTLGARVDQLLERPPRASR